MTNDSTKDLSSSSVSAVNEVLPAKKTRQQRPRISRKKLSEAISSATQYHKYEIEDILKSLPAVLAGLLLQGYRVKIDGLGTFYTKKGSTRKFMSSIDSKEHQVQTRDTLALKPDAEIKRLLNPDFE